MCQSGSSDVLTRAESRSGDVHNSGEIRSCFPFVLYMWYDSGWSQRVVGRISVQSLANHLGNTYLHWLNKVFLCQSHIVVSAISSGLGSV